MPGQLIPPPELAPPVADGLTPQESIRMWSDLVDTCEQFLLAGLQRTAAPGSDIRSVYRRWYAGQMEEHDRTIRRMVESFDRRVSAHAC
jgi:hypothetical protein